MSIDELKPAAIASKDSPETTSQVWIAVVMCLLFWTVWFVTSRLGFSLAALFFTRLGACGLALLAGIVFWWTRFHIPLRDRFIVAAVFVVGVVTASVLSHPSMGGFGMYLFGIPAVLTAATVALVLTRQSSPLVQRNAVIASLLAAFVGYTLIRMDGLWGNADSNYAFRWATTSEDRFLAEQQAEQGSAPASTSDGQTPAVPLEASAGDWTEFRGPGRAGAAEIGEFNADWTARPPQQVWKQRVGPAWSSMIVVAGRLFTQEQRGEKEALVCYDAATGDELWAADEEARYEDPIAGAGPRATPTFDDGRIYALGAKANLLCVEATTGKKVWSRDVLQDSQGEVQMWGFSTSPLVVGGKVIVFGGGKKGKSLLAYDAQTGDPQWTADAGTIDYSSPQLATFGERQVVLMMGELGLQGFDPKTGDLLFQWGEKIPNGPHSVQPHVASSDNEDRIYIATTQSVTEAKLSDSPDKWDFAGGWVTKDLKPDFNDFVIHDGHAYGFDRELFACVNLADGKRAWKARTNYGHGQVLLLRSSEGDQSHLLVLTETGEVALLAADPKKHRELGRFKAIEGKTWNHPVVFDGHLYVRNAEEMACYDLR